MQSLTEWFLANSAWLGFPLMAMLGGTIAHILAFETSFTRWTAGQHFGLLTISWMKAFFIAAVIFQLQAEYKWSLPLCFVATGLLSVFGTESIKAIYNLMMRRVFGKTGVPLKGNDAP